MVNIFVDILAPLVPHSLVRLSPYFDDSLDYFNIFGIREEEIILQVTEVNL